jgi:hypothetical protein
MAGQGEPSPYIKGVTNMSIAQEMTIFHHNQLVNFPCRICGGYADPCGFDFCVNEGEGLSPSFVCYACAKYLREDLIEIQKAGFEFARSGMVKDCIDTEKAVVGWASMPWQVDKPAAPPAASALPTDKEYLAEKHAHERRLESELLVRSLVEAKIKAERLGRLEDLDEGIEDENRQGMSLKEIEMLEFHRDNYVISYHREGPMGWLV